MYAHVYISLSLSIYIYIYTILLLLLIIIIIIIRMSTSKCRFQDVQVSWTLDILNMITNISHYYLEPLS